MECAKKGCFFENMINFPSPERLQKCPVAVIECCQEIPCNPCEEYCPAKAITVADNINSVPRIDFDRCTGCGFCLGFCPGLAIFLLDLSSDKGRITLPYELLPPNQGEEVVLLDRAGVEKGTGTVVKVKKMKQHDRTYLITLEVDKDLVKQVRGFRREK